MTKLKNSNCDNGSGDSSDSSDQKTKKKLVIQRKTKKKTLKLWQNSKTQIVTKTDEISQGSFSRSCDVFYTNMVWSKNILPEKMRKLRQI